MDSHRMIAQIAAALQSHEHWRDGLREAIEKGCCDMRSATAASDGNCDFGKWLHAPDVVKAVRHEREYRRVVQLHAAFHKCAGSVLSYVERGQASPAQFIMDGEYTIRSIQLITALGDWKALIERSAPPPLPPVPVLRRFSV